MYAIHGKIYHQYTPHVSINLPYDWILWERVYPNSSWWYRWIGTRGTVCEQVVHSNFPKPHALDSIRPLRDCRCWGKIVYIDVEKPMKNLGLPKKKRLLKWWEKPHLFVYQAGTIGFPFQIMGFSCNLSPLTNRLDHWNNGWESSINTGWMENPNLKVYWNGWFILDGFISWLVYFMENPNLKWIKTGSLPPWPTNLHKSVHHAKLGWVGRESRYMSLHLP